MVVTKVSSLKVRKHWGWIYYLFSDFSGGIFWDVLFGMETWTIHESLQKTNEGNKCNKSKFWNLYMGTLNEFLQGG